MEALGPKIRKYRRRLGLTLDELAGRTSISKPYLSLIETGRVTNPPSDEKLRRLEQVLAFTPGELVTQAHIQRTPRDVQAMLQKLMAGKEALGDQPATGVAAKAEGAKTKGAQAVAARPANSTSTPGIPLDLDAAYMSGVLQELVDNSVGNVERVTANAVPVINRVSAGYPRDFSDLGYPPRVADDYVSCPDVNDRDAFAARVHGDSMVPKYQQGDIVIFSPAASPREGDDCFVRFADGNTTFKRVFFESDGGKSVLRLQPRNEKYRPQTVPSENVAGLYRAIYRYQRVDGE
ncbi:MAG TPA: XRE family transcriptional regulator [Tepidisphaeraceae bacterium]|nr:XRE family transcriptional regulator [Tepidisphaeraceae bacterium]